MKQLEQRTLQVVGSNRGVRTTSAKLLVRLPQQRTHLLQILNQFRQFFRGLAA
jgi:hypothetical protein